MRLPTTIVRVWLTGSLLAGWTSWGAGQTEIPAGPNHEAAAKQLARAIVTELKDKGIRALSISLVDDQQIVWAAGFGLADAKCQVPATAQTVYRAGSVSKLFTDLAIMRLVEQGKLGLDEPVTLYLPEFAPRNRFGKPITLRQLMAHRSGLVREAPVGHYFDPTEPSLADAVHSLNSTELVYEPETRTKYSNAAIATVGYVLERAQNQAYARYMEQVWLAPLGMRKSGFLLTPALSVDVAKAEMWTYEGRTFEAPTFPLGTPPAGNLYTTVVDLGRFLSFLFSGGRGTDGLLVQPET